jgi:hypothetical protein
VPQILKKRGGEQGETTISHLILLSYFPKVSGTERKVMTPVKGFVLLSLFKAGQNPRMMQNANLEALV